MKSVVQDLQLIQHAKVLQRMLFQPVVANVCQHFFLIGKVSLYKLFEFVHRRTKSIDAYVSSPLFVNSLPQIEYRLVLRINDRVPDAEVIAPLHEIAQIQMLHLNAAKRGISDQ